MYLHNNDMVNLHKKFKFDKIKISIIKHLQVTAVEKKKKKKKKGKKNWGRKD